MADINAQGVPAYAPPNVYVELDFVKNSISIGNLTYAALIVAQCLPGTDGYNATPGTVIGQNTNRVLQSEQDIIGYAGAGSPAHRMFRRFVKFNKGTPVSFAPVNLQNTGATAASLNITVTTGTGQTSGVASIFVGDDNPVQAQFTSTSTAAQIATALAAAVNVATTLPVTATASSNVVTLTQKVAGARGNWTSAFAKISGSGVTVSVVAPTQFSDGAGSDVTNVLNTLNGLLANNRRFYRHIFEAGWDSVDAAVIAECASYIEQMAAPSVGRRQRAQFGSVDTLANTEAVSTTTNDARLEPLWCKGHDRLPGELAASWAAGRMVRETSPLRPGGVNLDFFGSTPETQGLWDVKAPLNGTAPSAIDIQSAIINGVTPLQVLDGNNTMVVKAVTSRFQSTIGSSTVQDLSFSDSGVITLEDYFFDDVAALMVLRWMGGNVIGQDNGVHAPAPGVATPSLLLGTVEEVIQDYSSRGLIDGAWVIANGLIVQQNMNPNTSMGIQITLKPNAPLHTIIIKGLTA